MSTSPNALIILVSLVALSAGLIGCLARRAGQKALGYWILGWGVLLASTSLLLIAPISPELRSVSCLFSSFASPLMALGAYIYSKRPEPIWILPAAASIGVLRLSLFLLGLPDKAMIAAALLEAPFAFLAAYLVLKRPHEAAFAPTGPERMLAGLFVLFGLTEITDAVSRQLGLLSGVPWAMWLVASLPLFTQQVWLQLNRISRQKSEIEARALATSERLNVLIPTENFLLVEIDQTGTIMFCNATGRPLPAATATDLVGKNVSDIARTSADFGLLNVLQTKGKITEEDVEKDKNQIRPPLPITFDGNLFYFETRFACYRTPAGDLRIVASIRDVTKRIQQEEAIQRNTLRLNRAEEIARAGSWEIGSAEDDQVHCSSQLTKLYGLPDSDDLVSISSLSNCLHPEDGETTTSQWQKFFQTPGRFELAYRIYRANDGALRHLRVVGEVERVDQGSGFRAIGATSDITDQRILEELLRRGKGHFDRFVEANIVGVSFMDTSGMIRDANTAFLKVIGYTSEDLPLHWNTLSADSERAEGAIELENILMAATPRPYEKNFLHKSGREAPALVAGAGLDEEQIIVLTVDLQERKIVEEYIEGYQLELEEMVALRTNELLESRNRLQETERLAAVGTLAAGVAHQINNPVGAILNSAEFALLCRGDEDSNIVFERALKNNLAEAKRCAQIVRSMLQFSRDQPAERWVEDLRGIARRAHRAILPYANDCHAKVSLTLPERTVFARVSPIEIEQAIVNALRNSIESADHGATVSLTLDHRDKRGWIEVIDNGRGIPEEEIEHLFNPFYSTRTKVGGTGLGLSVAHGIVKAHAGDIEVRSTLGSGTRLIMSLPVIDAEIGAG